MSILIMNDRRTFGCYSRSSAVLCVKKAIHIIDGDNINLQESKGERS